MKKIILVAITIITTTILGVANAQTSQLIPGWTRYDALRLATGIDPSIQPIHKVKVFGSYNHFDIQAPVGIDVTSWNAPFGASYDFAMHSGWRVGAEVTGIYDKGAKTDLSFDTATLRVKYDVPLSNHMFSWLVGLDVTYKNIEDAPVGTDNYQLIYSPSIVGVFNFTPQFITVITFKEDISSHKELNALKVNIAPTYFFSSGTYLTIDPQFIQLWEANDFIVNIEAEVGQVLSRNSSLYLRAGVPATSIKDYDYMVKLGLNLSF